MDVTASGPAILALAENWFPAWEATVNGESTPVLRADHALRAVAVPAGSHRVELRYRSSLLAGSLVVTVVCSLILLLCAFSPGLRRLVGSRDSGGSRDDVGG